MTRKDVPIAKVDIINSLDIFQMILMGLIRKWRYKWIKQDWMKLKEEIKYYKLVKNGKIMG